MCVSGSQRDLGQTNFPALQQTAKGKKPRVGKGKDVMPPTGSILASNNSILDTNGSTTESNRLTPTNGSETVV